MASRQVGTFRARACALAAVALAACGRQAPEQPAVQGGGVAVATFLGEVDPRTGAVTLTPLPDSAASALSSWGALQPIPIRQNGIWNDVGDGAVEMRTVTGSTTTVTGGCGGTDFFQADVEIHSGFLSQRLLRPYVEITSVPTGNESCMSVPSPEGGVSEQYGLFPYPDIGPGGYGTGTWSFRIPTTTAFRFFARVIAQPVEVVAPVTTPTLPGGAVAVTLSCADAGSGCAGTFYAVDGGATQSYVSPVRLSGTQTLCFWSEDVAGNVEGQRCQAFTVTAGAATATFDGALGTPRCSAISSSCDTGAGGPPAGLIHGSGTIAELHSPNTLTVDGCADGTELSTSAYGALESLDRLTIATLDGGPLMPGRQVRLTWRAYAGDPGDVFFAFYTDRLDPAHLWTTVPGAAGSGVAAAALYDPNYVDSVVFTLPEGATAIRGRFGYLGMPAGQFCAASPWDDLDDLVFATNVDPAGVASPTALVASPAANATVSRTAIVTATASADYAVAKVELFAKASSATTWNSIGVDTAPPWAFSWDTTPYFGDTDLRVVATDNSGLTGTSPVVTVKVADQTPPAVFLVTPAANQALVRSTAVTLSANAQDPRLIGSVAFYVDGVPVGTTVAEFAPNVFNVTWNASGFALGTHTIVARATDQAGNVAESARITFTLQ